MKYIARRNFPRRRVIIKGFDGLWQGDLMEFLPYSCDNNGYKYVLILIYCFSKYGWSHPLKNKGAEEVREAMSNILQEGRSPKNLQTDAGKEFYNEKFKKLMRTYEINHFSTYSTKKASIVERVIRTIKNMLYKTFSLRGSYKWIDILSEITTKYNNNTKLRGFYEWELQRAKHTDVYLVEKVLKNKGDKEFCKRLLIKQYYII